METNKALFLSGKKKTRLYLFFNGVSVTQFKGS